MSEQKCCCSSLGSPEQQKKLDEVINEYKNVNGGIIPVLHQAQEIYGYLPMEVQKVIAKRLNVSLAEIYGIVTFYSQFSLTPKGKYKINVCLGTACYVKGANIITDKFKEQLKIDVGGCTEDGKFSLDATRCIGACGLAPVLTVNEDVYGKVVPEQIADILAKY